MWLSCLCSFSIIDPGQVQVTSVLFGYCLCFMKCLLSLKKTSDTAAHPCNTTAFCCPGDGGVASSIPSQSTLASSSSLDIFDPLPAAAPASTNPTRKTPESFLGPNAALVNLDSLVTKPAQPAPAVNPFLASTGEGEEEKTCLGLHWIP